MSKYERSVTVGVPPDNAFRYLSSVSNLPNFIPHLRRIQEEEDSHVWGIAEFDGRSFEVSGFFRADEANRRLDWESDGAMDYRGWMQIAPEGADHARITIHLSFETLKGQEEKAGFSAERIERDLETAAGKLRDVLEREARILA